MFEEMHVSQISLKIDGLPAAKEVIDDLMEVIVDHSLHLPSMFMLRLSSRDMRWLEDPTFREGKRIEIFCGERLPITLLAGKIADLEPELDPDGPALLVRGYDLSHKLYRGRQRRSFVQMTDADLARKLAIDAGLTPGTIDKTSEVHEYVFQNNQTNAEFLLERARRLGYELWVEDRALHFRKPAPNGEPVRLVWGDTLRHFRPRLSTAEQLNEVEVRGWDPKHKRAVVGRATQGKGAPQIGLPPGATGATIAKDAWGEAKLAVVDQLVHSPAEAEMLAQAVLDEAASAFVEAEGVCESDPTLVPGRQVKIEGVGSRFAGTYYLTEVRHVWTSTRRMETHFTVSGRRDRGVWSLLAEAIPCPLGMNLVIGIVTNNKDPEELGRVKVTFPWLCDTDESAWARVVSPMAGAGRGFFALPEIDDEVLVGFEHGDIHRPFVLGALWNGRDMPPTNTAVGGDGKVNQRILKSRSGHTITLNDTAGSEEITIVDKTGNNKIVFDSPSNSINITVEGDLNMEARGKIRLKAGAEVEITDQSPADHSFDTSTAQSLARDVSRSSGHSDTHAADVNASHSEGAASYSDLHLNHRAGNSDGHAGDVANASHGEGANSYGDAHIKP
jgi:phage protein D/phage baseplate assembly protein gpV